MVKVTNTFVALLASSLIGSAVAHPGEHHDHEEVKREISERSQHAAYAKRTLANCTNSVSSRALKARSVARRAERAQQLRAARGITTGKLS
jgi:cob(I)alamin adenosyltransferase